MGPWKGTSTTGALRGEGGHPAQPLARLTAPGLRVQRSCLPKDLRALTYQAKLLDLESPVINAVLRSKHSHFVVAVQRITISTRSASDSWG